MRCVSLLIACVAAVLLAGCNHASGYPPAPVPRPTSVTGFATLYSENCAACHGANGQSGPAIDLANPEYQALADDASLRKWISKGMPGTEMPAFAESAGGMLTEAQIDALITGMRREWSRPNAFGGATPPGYAQTQNGDVQRGAATYKARCASCHESSHQEITGSDYLALTGDQALRSIIVAGRPDIGQPDWRHDAPGGREAPPLSAQEVDDIVSYLASLRGNSQPTPANAPTAQSTLPTAGRRSTP